MSNLLLQSPKLEIRQYNFEVVEPNKISGLKRIFAFFIFIVGLPSALIIGPLYLRKIVFTDVEYAVAESDIIEIRDGISSIFCQQHTLRMNTNFNAFQLQSKPEISSNHKHIRLKKSMTLPDDTLEYWGFYLLKGAKVHVKFCSRYDGSRILVVKGKRELKTCGLLDHNRNKGGANFAKSNEQVKVFFEDITELTRPFKNSNQSNVSFMDLENHASEDLAEDSNLDKDSRNLYSESKANLDFLNNSTKKLRKKLKKGTKRTLNKQSPGKQILSPSKSDIKSAKDNVREKRQARHTAQHQLKKRQLLDNLYKERNKRDQVYDRKYSHGGNAINFTETDESNSISSFENGLFECYNGDILLAEGFKPSAECLNTHFLENGTHRMITKQEITQDGYYYYIFYSDNDVVRNDIHAIFDIYKPTFQYSNLRDSQGCINATNCTFPISFLSDEIVVVEVPTRDGIEHEDDDITKLISTCHPRIAIYAIFPISVLILILSFSFL